MIAFSNANFYDRTLQTFPGPFAPDAHSGVGRALEWERVEGFYQPSGKGAGKDGGTNRIEAKRVAQLAVEHARTCPDESLGIITFSEPQRRAVEEEWHRLVAGDRSLDAFAGATGEGAFFIKALENVQGDERDAIFFSVGFGPRRGSDGQIKPMMMNFGPLNKDGGERRLNVAVTRAKTKIKIVTSFEPEEIRVEKLRARGGKLLRAYIEFAKSGAVALAQSKVEGAEVPTSDLARQIARELEAAGWRTHLNVGLGEFRIDVGTENPDVPGALLLGLSFDGAHYAGAATARDRDRLRPFVLGRLGWRLLPVWSPDFARNPARDIKRITAELDRARAEDSLRREGRAQLLLQRNSISDDDAADAGVFFQDEIEEPDGTVWDGSLGNSDLEFSADAADMAPLGSDVLASEVVSDDDLASESDAPLFWGAPFEAVELEPRGDDGDFDWLVMANSPMLREVLIEVVNGEGPVSHAVTTRRIIAAWGMRRAGARLQATVSALAARAEREGLIQVRPEQGSGEWYWPAEMALATPRPPLDEWSVRPHGEICLEEIAEGAICVVQAAYSISRDDLISQTARHFGYKQTGRLVRQRFSAAVDLLESDPRIALENFQFVWAGPQADSY